MEADPLLQFFPGDEGEIENILYKTLSVESTATAAEINKAYRKLALIHHPDKHSNGSEERKEEESKIFQRVGFAYAVLRDEGRRKRYDSTGLTSESAFLSQGEEMGWEAYFEEVFEKVTKAKMDEMKKEYQGSAEELTDLLSNYLTHSGSLDLILSHIPHSTHLDEPRFIQLIDAAIARKDVDLLPGWTKAKKDEKGQKKRKREGEKEAKEAEEAAKEMGVWDEFYGSGKATEKKKKTGKKGGRKPSFSLQDDDNAEAADEEDTSSLQALIQRNAAKRSDSFLSSMEAKYGPGGSASTTSKKGGKGKKKKEEKEHAAPEEIDDATFEKLQAEMMARKSAPSSSKPESNGAAKKKGAAAASGKSKGKK
ncbi:hypothetical protein BDY24DRAFT_388316 [Mrakia frigida]|uniref:J domain-containing protein n=1 Tax=Mrakia frigida TaxID=29902 RepID=UPI003FCC149D